MYTSWVSWFFAYVMVWSVSPFFLHYAPIQNSHFQKDQKVTVTEHLATASTSKTSKAAPFSDDFLLSLRLRMLSGCSVVSEPSTCTKSWANPAVSLVPETCRAERFEVQLAGFALNFEDL